MAGKKLTLKNELTQRERFNSLEKLAEIIPADKMIMFTHKASKVVVVAAKDTGKSLPVQAYQLCMMERDPNIVHISAMKYSTGATKKLKRSLNNTYLQIKNMGYHFGTPSKEVKYEAADSFFYRMVNQRNKLLNQYIELVSFENTDQVAGWTPSNAGYPQVFHIEEPAIQGDNHTPDRKEWNTNVKTILDTVKRHYRTWKQKVKAHNNKIDRENPDMPEDERKKRYMHEPQPFKTIITMNDWEPDHPESIDTEKYHPQSNFLDWALGFEYAHYLKFYEAKIDGETVLPELLDIIDKRWEDIKVNVLNNHTQWKYVEYNENNEYIDTLYGRMQKFANPTINPLAQMELKGFIPAEESPTEEDIFPIPIDESTMKEVYAEMYSALIKGDSLALAKAFGMGYDGSVGENKRFNLKNWKPIDTEEKLLEPGRTILGLCMAWDHDANRGPLGTPVTISARQVNKGNPAQPDYQWIDLKVMIHEQYHIEGYGKGVAGNNTKRYHEMMTDISKLAHQKFLKGSFRVASNINTYAIFDDDDGSYVYRFAEDLKNHYGYVNSLHNKTGKFNPNAGKDGYDVDSRDMIWQDGLDYDIILVDSKNADLVKWIRLCPVDWDAKGKAKRSTKGKWGKRYKDISNSAEYGFWPFRNDLFAAVRKEESE